MRKKRQSDVGWGEPEPEKAEPMALGPLMEHQWKSYQNYHRSKVSLALHVVAIPMFWAALAYLGMSLFNAQLWGIGVGAAGIGASMALQGIGHSREQEPPEAFASPLEAISRVFLEQFVSFPRYVLTGGFFKAWRGR